MKELEQSGRTADEAIERALQELGISREDAEIEVLDHGSRGMLGLGVREARVRVRVKRSPAISAHQITQRLLQAMGFLTAAVHARQHDDAVTVDVGGQGLAPLIGRRGVTLDALELLVGLMVSKQAGVRTKVRVDIEGYRERRRGVLEALGARAAERARREAREIMLEPMDSYERRIVHTALANHPDVMTFSRGEGSARRVVVAPRPAHEGDAPSREP